MKTFPKHLILVLLGASVAASSHATVRAANIFNDHMVLQQGKPIHVWGTANPAEHVVVSLDTDTGDTVADSAGDWQITLPALTAHPGNPTFDLRLQGDGGAIVLHDVLLGEVWLDSGQSNMAFEMGGVVNAREEIAAANHPDIRMFTVGRLAYSPLPVKDVTGSWAVATPAKAANFSAVAYYFAVALEAALHVPVGIINSSVSGSPILAWTSLDALAAEPAMQLRASGDVDHAIHYADELEAFLAARPAWETKFGIRDTTAPVGDEVAAYTSDAAPGWEPTEFPLKGPEMAVTTGAVTWFRGRFSLPANVASVPIQRLNAGMVRESCIAWLNGVRIGDYGLHVADRPKGDLVFKVPAGTLHEGANTIVLRIFAHDAPLTYFGSKPVTLAVGDGASVRSVPLDAAWQRRTETVFPAVSSAAAAAYPEPPLEMTTNTATVLYRSMIEPLRDYAISGALWYQGESNTGQADYRVQLPLMIADWRKQWHDSFPFYLVQLPNYGQPARNDTDKNGWAMMREMQAQIAASVPNSGMAVTIDLGDVGLLHPPNKKPVGERLARLALARVYKLTVHDSGPIYSSATFDGGVVRIALAHAEGLHSPSPSLHEFLIAGADRKFHPADASIRGASLIVSSPEVLQPLAVRYAWVDAPEHADLVNSDGLALAPFRTDDWPFPTR